MKEIKAGDKVRLCKFPSSLGLHFHPDMNDIVGTVAVVEQQDRVAGILRLVDSPWSWDSEAVELVESAPRRIRLSLSLASDTTTTECGGCEHVAEHCRVFDRRILVWDSEAGQERLKRLPECIAAEVLP